MKHEKQGFYLDASIKNKPIINTLLQYIGGGVKMEEETKPEDVEEEQKEPTEKEKGAEWFFMIPSHITIEATIESRAVHKCFIDS